jgi:hypothetical protein
MQVHSGVASFLVGAIFSGLASVGLTAVLVDRRGCDWPRTSVAGSLPQRQLADGG